MTESRCLHGPGRPTRGRWNRCARVVLAGALAVVALPRGGEVARAQADRNVDEAAVRRIIEEHRGGVKTGERTYRTPPIFKAARRDTQRVAADRIRGKRPTTGGDNGGGSRKELQPFGYDVFDAPSETFFDPVETPVPDDYRVGPGDHLVVNLWGRVEKTLELTVDREGNVFLPTAGEVILWGLTIGEAESRVREAFGRVYSDFEMNLTMGRIRTIQVYVFGAVRKPGAYTVSSLSTLFNVLYLSGGPNERGSLRSIRHTRGGDQLATVDLYDVLVNGRNVDRGLRDNDVIFVPVVDHTAAIRGCVRRPAIYELLGKETIGDLVALAGGTDADAYLENVLVNRVEDNARHVVINVDLAAGDDSTFAIADGDTVEVRPVYRDDEKTVELRGTVKYPGVYEYRPGMRVSDLLDGQLVLESFRRRANILRTRADLSRELIAVNLQAAVAGDSSADALLRERDVVTVYSRRDMQRTPYVSVEGNVVREGKHELTAGMRLSDAIFLSGGLKKSAFLLYAEVARVGPAGHSDILRVNLKACVENPGSRDDLTLAEDDRVFIREIPEWSLHDLVAVEGEVRFPGRYALNHRHETLSEVIGRAGGFTENAFLPGAVFERASIAEDISRRNITGIMENLQEVTLDTLRMAEQHRQLTSLRTSNLTRIVVDLPAIFEQDDASRDVEIRGGDRIYIPPLPSGVHVMGAVASSGTIKFREGKGLSYYVQRAGGLVKSADRGEIRVVKPDGRVYTGASSHASVGLGDSIVIPRKVSRERNWWKVITNSVTIVTSAATMAYMVTRL